MLQAGVTGFQSALCRQAGTDLPMKQQGVEVVYQALLQVLPLQVTDGAAGWLHHVGEAEPLTPMLHTQNCSEGRRRQGPPA